MYYNYQYVYDSQQRINQLQEIVEKQSQQMSTLEELVRIMQQEIIHLREKPSMNIEKIEYKFDQLKVETLEGTLNIGLTPGSTGEIEDFLVTQNNLEVPTPMQPQKLYQGIENELKTYLEKNGTSKIKQIAQTNGKNLEEHYYDFMIQDVRKQLPSRINHTLNTLTAEALEKGYKEDKIKEITIKQLKRDMDNAFTAFIQNLPKNQGVN
ncbi:putative spore germination protein GerPC [Bacillus sp. THAF10]|uniref:spore germination protein GerPC n=1 Tax=Bacillus sp. THAF10 TaxID=2587848 RepID=UPI0012A8E367|nr:spore germination protein GerPC [Bacillus sp. THAF10]QFT88314.1 putative spore germination protein GerPC [Bacillus sp. THAF10]